MKRIEAGKPEPLVEALGLVRDTKDDRPQSFFPPAHEERPGNGANIMLRTAGCLRLPRDHCAPGSVTAARRNRSRTPAQAGASGGSSTAIHSAPCSSASCKAA